MLSYGRLGRKTIRCPKDGKERRCCDCSHFFRKHYIGEKEPRCHYFDILV